LILECRLAGLALDLQRLSARARANGDPQDIGIWMLLAGLLGVELEAA